MPKCELCGQEVELPFKCSFCGKHFCIDHRLPENHKCPTSPDRIPLGSWHDKKAIAAVAENRAREKIREIPLPSLRSTPKSEASEGELHFVKGESIPSEIPRKSKSPLAPVKPVKEIRSLLSSYLISVLCTIGGFGIVLWQIFSPIRIILFINVIPIPLILIGIVMFAFGFATNIYALVSMIRHSSVSVKLVTIPLAFSLVIFSSFGIVMINTMHQTLYLGTSIVDTRRICDQVFDLINEERKSRDLPELSFDANLQSVSQTWSEDLAERRVLEHGDFAARMGAIGYGDFQCGEIIAEISLGGLGFLQSPVERGFIDGWLASPGHRVIMLTPSSGFLGVGCAKNSYTVYCVADFRFD